MTLLVDSRRLRQGALDRIGLLGSCGRALPGQERLLSYFERQNEKNVSGRVSERHLSAFLGLCVQITADPSRNPSCSGAYILRHLQDIVDRWELPERSTSEISFPLPRLRHVCQIALRAALCRVVSRTNEADSSIFAFASQLIAKIPAEIPGRYMKRHS